MITRVLCALCVATILQSQPVIRVTTRLVEVNVIVRDKHGPLRDLTKADFKLFDRGKPREIAFFSMNSVMDSPAPVKALPANVFTNDPEIRGANPANATVILLDGVNTSITDRIYSTREFYRFLSQMQPQDRIAVYSLGRSLQVLNDFTGDPRRLMASVRRHMGRNDASSDNYVQDEFATGDAKTDAIWNAFLQREQDFDLDRRVNLTVAALEAVANRIASIPGRKNLIWVSGSFPFAIMGRENPRMFAREINRAARALNAADVAVYPVDARGLAGMAGLSADNRRAPAGGLSTANPMGQDTMNILAQATGGRAFMNSNDIQGAIRTVMRDSEVTYTLAFQPDPNTLDSTFHNISVKVNRSGVEVRCREGYQANPDPPPSDQQRSVAIQNSLAGPLEAAAIRARVELQRGADLGLTVIVDSKDISLEPANGRWTATLDAVFSQRANGRDLGTVVYTLRPDLDGKQYEEAQRAGLGFVRRLPLAAGADEVKVVIFDRQSGRLGSVIVPLETAPDAGAK